MSKYFLQCSTFASEGPQVRTWGCQTCFLPRAPPTVVTPPASQTDPSFHFDKTNDNIWCRRRPLNLWSKVTFELTVWDFYRKSLTRNRTHVEKERTVLRLGVGKRRWGETVWQTHRSPTVANADEFCKRFKSFVCFSRWRNKFQRRGRIWKIAIHLTSQRSSRWKFRNSSKDVFFCWNQTSRTK